ncbi:MAG: hypothetical protein OEV64_11425 [Desulfobulbaceae bacterium]|nr:hypothetical protein [Desulfobulbaceae bacterium]
MFKGKIYQFHLGIPGIAGIGVVLLCLFFWMFLLGIWAGQTIILPLSPMDGRSLASGSGSGDKSEANNPVRIIQPSSIKKPVSESDDR